MNNERVTPEQAAKELNIGVLTLRGLMQEGKLDIGYALKKPGKTKWGYYIFRGLLDKEKERIGRK